MTKILIFEAEPITINKEEMRSADLVLRKEDGNMYRVMKARLTYASGDRISDYYVVETIKNHLDIYL